MEKHHITNEQLNGLVGKICRDISVDNWRPDFIVGITSGGLIPAVMMSHYFNVPCETLKVIKSDYATSESNLWMAEEALGYVPTEERGESGTQIDPSYRKNILIVNDINDTGGTINWIVKDWRSGCLPSNTAWGRVWENNVRFAVVYDNLSSRAEIAPSYVGESFNKMEDDIKIEFPYETWWQK
jgi:hypoxanthine phosphoribosyltransferase